MLVQVTHMFSFHSLWQHQKTIYFLFSRNVISTSSVLSNLSGLTKFYSPWNHQETFGFLMISGRLKVYKCAQIWSEFRQPFLNYFYNIFRVFFLSFLELFFVIYTTYNQWSFNISPFSLKMFKCTFTWDPKWTQTVLKSQTAVKCRSVYMAI